MFSIARVVVKSLSLSLGSAAHLSRSHYHSPISRGSQHHCWRRILSSRPFPTTQCVISAEFCYKLFSNSTSVSQILMSSGVLTLAKTISLPLIWKRGPLSGHLTPLPSKIRESCSMQLRSETSQTCIRTTAIDPGAIHLHST